MESAGPLETSGEGGEDLGGPVVVADPPAAKAALGELAREALETDE